MSNNEKDVKSIKSANLRFDNHICINIFDTDKLIEDYKKKVLEENRLINGYIEYSSLEIDKYLKITTDLDVVNRKSHGGKSHGVNITDIIQIRANKAISWNLVVTSSNQFNVLVCLDEISFQNKQDILAIFEKGEIYPVDKDPTVLHGTTCTYFPFEDQGLQNTFSYTIKFTLISSNYKTLIKIKFDPVIQTRGGDGSTPQ